MTYRIEHMNHKEMRVPWTRLMIALVIPLVLTGCAAVGPDYQPPAMEMPAAWQGTDDPALLPRAQLVQKWWSLFHDPLLDRLIQTATQSNRDLLAAIARMEEARANLGSTRGEYYPQVEANGSAIWQETSDNGLSTGVEETLHGVGASAGWEVDLFGRIRRSVEAAAADYQASAEDRTDVLISLYANVALTYLDVRTFQARLTAARSNIDSQKSVLALTRSRFRNGLATDLNVAQAQRILASTEAEVPPLNIGLSQSINALAVLLGQTPGSLSSELAVPLEIPLPPEKVTVGVPANLLRQRPDVRRAERRLAAQTARIGVLKADLYPSFSLTGAFGFESIDAGTLFDTDSRIASFGPSLRWQIFSGGRIRQQIKAQDARTRQALFGYEQSVLNALREVENALVAYVEDRTRLAAINRSVTAARRSVKLATELYKQGLVDFQQVLDAQRDQFNFENQFAAAKGNSAANFVRLYAALGGGWDPTPAPKPDLNDRGGK
ncbi:MAG: efflux transporter outer membrane subunit [Desulfobacterales bacterium]|nr:efflux transporter outer membrane subunit [Desulfobacterales bacterium]